MRKDRGEHDSCSCYQIGFYEILVSKSLHYQLQFHVGKAEKKNCHKHEKSHEPASSLIYFFHMVYLDSSLAIILWENTEPREKSRPFILS